LLLFAFSAAVVRGYAVKRRREKNTTRRRRKK